MTQATDWLKLECSETNFGVEKTKIIDNYY